MKYLCKCIWDEHRNSTIRQVLNVFRLKSICGKDNSSFLLNAILTRRWSRSVCICHLPRLHYITYSDQFNDNVQHCIIVITTLLPRPSQTVLYLYLYFVFSCPSQAFGKIQNALIFVFVSFVFHISHKGFDDPKVLKKSTQKSTKKKTHSKKY